MGNNFISPLRRAVRSDDAGAVERLLQEAGDAAPDLINDDYTADCFIDVCQRNASPVLHTAIACQRMDIVEVLIKYGADPSACGYWRETALHKAARQDNLALATLLIKAGADPSDEDRDGATALHLAAGSRMGAYFEKCDVLTLLLDDGGGNGSKRSGKQHQRAANDAINGVKDDISNSTERGVGTRYPLLRLGDDAGNTALHHACLSRNLAACRLLVSRGAATDARNAAGRTPIDLAPTDDDDGEWKACLNGGVKSFQF